MNKDDLILANAGLEGAGLAQNSVNDQQSAIDDEVFKLIQNSQPPIVQNKVNTLAAAKQEKLDRLAGTTVDASGGLNGLTGSQFKDKLAAIAQQPTNNLTPEDLQYALGYATSNPIQQDGNGQYFKLKEDANGHFIEDSNGQNEKEYINSKYRPGRYLYIDNTVDGNMKLGLAANGFNARYNPNSPEAKAITNSPGWKNAKYHQKDVGHYGVTQDMVGKLKNINADDSIKPYGWSPGPKGVTVNDGPLLNDLLDYNVATDLEKTIHSNIGQIKDRAIGQGPITKQEIRDFGSGKTEYTLPDAPVWNMNYKDDGKPLQEGTPLPKAIKPHTLARKQAEADAVWNNLFGEESDDTIAGRAANTVKSGASMFTQGFAGLADLGAEGIQALGNATGIDALHSDGEGIWKDGEVSKKIDDAFGVDEKYSQQAQKEALNNYKKYKETGDWKYLGKSAWSLLTTPEMYGTSIGFVFGGGVLGVASKANKIRKAAQGFMKLDKTLTKAQAVEKAKDTVESMTKTQKLVENLAHRQPAMVGYSYNDLGNQKIEYKKVYGEEMPTGQQAAAFGLDIVANNFDYWADSAAAHGKGVVQNFLKPAFENAPKEVKDTFIQKATQAGKKGLTILTDMGVESGTEYAQNVAQGYGTDMGHKTLSESMDARHDENMVAALGGATGYVQMKGIHNTGKAILNSTGKAIDALDEKINYHNNNLEDPDKTSKPITLDGKYNMWDSVGQPNFKVEDSKAKDTYAQTIAEFATDLHFNQDARKKYGYMGQKSKGEKNIDNVLEDATNKIADVYDLKDPKSKDIAKYLLVQKLTNVARAKNVATGEYKINKEEQEALLKETAEFVKGSKPAEIAFLDMQKQELKDAFTNKVNIKKADEYMTKYGLDQVNNGQIIADLMTLDDTEYDNLKKSVQSMKLMGSSDSVIINEMDSVSKDLDKLRNVATILGSDEGTTGTSGTTRKLHKKTYQEVADEVKHTGFLTRNGAKKSLDKHATDMDLFVGHDHIPEEMQNGPITALEEFVKHRGINKVRPFNITDKETNNKILNTDTGISTILNQRTNENNDLLNIVDTTLNRIDKEKNPETVQRLEKMKEDMLEHQKQHEEIQKLITSSKEEDKKLAYHKLNEYSTGIDSNVIDELLAENPNKWHTYDSNYKKVDTTDYSNVDTTEADMSVVEPEVKVISPSTDNVKSFVNKIIAGKFAKHMTKEEQQFQANNSKAIEAELKKRKANTSTSKTKLLDDGVQPKNEYAEVTKGDSTSTIPTSSKDKEAPEISLDEKLTVSEKVEPKQPKTHEEEIKEVEKAATYMDWLEKQLDNAVKEMRQLRNKHKVLKGLQREYLIDIKDVKAKLKDARNEIVGLELVKDRVETVPKGAYKRFMSKYQNSIIKLKNVIRALKGVITKHMKKIVKLQNAEDSTAEELGAIEIQLNKLAKKIGMLKKAKVEAKVEDARTVRNGMEEILGDLVEPNNKNTNSISALLTKDATDEQIMELMPTIVKKSKDGMKMIQRAKVKFTEFKAMRKTADNKEVPIGMFPIETVKLDKHFDNPLVDFTNGENSVPFRMLWDLEERESTDPEYKAYKNEIRRNVKNAMHVASALTLKDMIDVRMGNSEYIDDMVDQGFASVWNNIKDKEQAKTQKAKLKKAIKSGQLVPEAVFRENAGRRMFKELELMLNKNLEIQQITDIQNAMGVLVINNLLPVGRVNGELVTNGKVPNVVKRGLATLNDKGIVELVDTGDKSDEMKNGIEKLAVIRTINLSKLNKQYLSDIGDMGTVLEFAEARDGGSIGLEKMTHKKGATIKNSDVPLAEGVREYLNKQGSIPWKFIGLEDKLKSYKEEDPENYIENFTKELIGTEEDLVAETPTMNLDSELAKHRAEALTIERMLKAHEMVGDGKKFYIKWDYTVSGRSMMDNKLVNPQSSGLSRFVVAADGMINNIDTKTISPEEINHIELAMAQALDIDIDKQPHEDALAELHDKFVTIKKTDKGLKLNWAKTKPNRLKELVEDKKFTLGSIRELNDKLEANTDIDPKAADLEYSSKTILHMVQAIDLLRDIEQGKDKISTNLAIEADGITNGMAIMLMQMGWSNYTQSMLRKAGVYATNDEFNNHGDYKKAGNTDIYESPVKLIQTAMKEKVTSQIDELLGTKKWRNFMKNPVMTFIYGSGLKSITKSVAESLIIGNSYIPGALATGKINELLKFAEVDGIKPEYKKYIKQKDGQWKLTNIVGKARNQLTEEQKKKYAYLNDYQITQITRAIVKKIEKPFTDGFTKTFKDVIDFRQALKTVEQANYAIFNIKFNEKVKALGKTKMNKLTIDELKQIKQEMIDEGTYYATDAAVKGQLVDYWKTGQSDTQSGRITVAINTNSFQSRTGTYNRDYNQIIKDLEASVGAIGVTTVHAVDGSIMVEGHVQDVLNVYDALVMGSDFKKNTEQVQGMNKAFYDINTRHSILGKSVEKLVAMTGMRNGAAIDSDLAVQLLSDIQRINPDYEIGTEEKLVNDIMDTLEKIDIQREALVKQDMIVNQYAASSDIAGVDTRNETVNTDGRYKVFGEDKEAEVKAVKEALEWIIESAINVRNEEEVNKNAGIMIDKLSNIYNNATDKEKAQMMRNIEEVTGLKDKTFAEQLQEIKKDC